MSIRSQVRGVRDAKQRYGVGRSRFCGEAAVLFVTVAIAGCGSGTTTPAGIGVPQATLSAASLAFGQVTVGTSVQQTLSLSNGGSGTLSGLRFSLNDTTNFSVSNTCGASLAASATCTVSVTFQPATAGVLNATLTVNDNAAGAPQTVQLSGTATTVPLPQATLTPASLSFSANLGGASDLETATLANTGSAPLQLAGAALSDTSNYSVSSTCGASLAAGTMCSYTVNFQPQARGSLPATLTITDNAGGVTNAAQVLALTGTAHPPISTVTNFGDSITCGYYALPQDGAGLIYSTQGYAGLLDTTIGRPAQNLCRPGDQAADMDRLWVYPNSSPQLGAHQLYTVLIGTNDAHACGGSSGCMTNWANALTASLTWLALPGSDKVLGSAITNLSGSWVPDFYSIGLAATGAGNTLSFPVTQAVAGRTLYIGYRVYDSAPGSAGSASVVLDGVPVMDLSASAGTGQPLLTQNGTTDTVFVAAIPLGAPGQHTLSLTTTSSAGVPFTFVWAGVSSSNYLASVSGPRVLLGGITASSSASLQATINSYNSALNVLVTQLTNDGMDVEIVPTAAALDTSTDMTDILHPNNAGHAKLAAAFNGVL